MSYGREYLSDHAFERDYPFGLPNDYWPSKNGKIALKNMTENHIRNCMRLVGEDDPWYGRFQKELARREENRS